ncbi:MAG TPA: YwmB family TATA-box binding protein [Bacillota bacterium]|nr:YwmB family TATA-box binding protein [Peptococcaceae bacterium MAG4]NLW37640.1 hypothetical protein [Peptococcaceae bacterium]HPZ42707.1 YwmB family TATA-box binding protein [Bacillota bacterium]HQD76230.1 YwmB family TATA-box binding protein [Bacillota bacterium]HUM59624.1 YwmB family TATA-box binding protein [Bacillota bacterium]
MVAPGVLAVFFLLAFALSPACRDTLGAYRENATMIKLLQCSGAELSSVNITGWVRVDEGTTGTREPLELVNRVAARLGLSGDGRSYESWQNPYARGIRLTGRLAGGYEISVAGQTMEIERAKMLSHVMVSLDGVDGKKTGYYKRKIREALKGCGGESHTAVTYAGKIGSGLNTAELLAGAERMMEQAEARIQQKVVKDNLVSLTGLSPQFDGDLRYDKQGINLNVALRTDPVEQVTYVYAASPVIFTEY